MAAEYIVGTIDAAQIALYAFWLFFAGLIVYLVRESMREGFPAISETTGKTLRGGLILSLPEPKTFIRSDGSTVTVPEPMNEYALKAEPTNAYTGAPLTPTGDPLVDGIGPAAWAQRPDRPDVTAHGDNRIVPLRSAKEFWLDGRDPDPRGMKVVCLDSASPGTVSDVWIDRAEYMVRYLEVQTGERKVMLPMTMAVIDPDRAVVRVKSVTADQMTRAPGTKKATSVTLLEEDRIGAYYAGGTLYATPARTEPLL
ncbi:photosynthetic reaction center subunit H [Limibaculum sp. FT325]|uniref:photosynthetic reaction center subunit H n=1 Tax=Thermohalobaculum sediminis TaxID=2939436 RepID=UPI00201C0114|nr:photosynthetic reaction center subunit H [Limibaculum sediminis]MCL5778605.1 photosynthetic reaction center subunit H [Limibaculum sediminis]